MVTAVNAPGKPYPVRILTVLLAVAAVLGLAWPGAARSAERKRPNVIFILADDLGYGDLGCYGGQMVATPQIDRMAAEGMRFTQFYAGATVCAPSRCVLMTGRHTGHATVRGNADPQRQSLADSDFTLAELLRGAGYATALVGKWGLGDEGTPGVPWQQGFDTFYGYLNQHHAHNYYPEFLWRNDRQEPLRNVLRRQGADYEALGAGVAEKKADYSHDLFAAEALKYVEARRDGPFFLYLAYTIPHANNEATRLTGNGQEVPDFGAYADRPWSDAAKGQAAMIARMDADVGRLLARLKELGIDEETVVFFSSDNGPHHEGGFDVEVFDQNGPLRGAKRDLYEGGVRVPMIVRWPGRVAAGTTSDHQGYFGDLMATLGELAGAALPADLPVDSISFVPTLLGKPAEQKSHAYLYWEFYEQGSKQAVRQGPWKAIRMPMLTGRTELYRLDDDLAEARDVAADHPDVVARLEALMDEAHVPSDRWQVPKGKQK